MNQVKLKELRKFGVLVGTIFVLIGLAPMRKGLPARPLALELGAVLVIFAAVQPSLLQRPHWVWTKIGAVLGWINARILLTIVFFFVLTPIAFIRKLFGGSNHGFRAGGPTYAETVTSRDPAHMNQSY